MSMLYNKSLTTVARHHGLEKMFSLNQSVIVITCCLF